MDTKTKIEAVDFQVHRAVMKYIFEISNGGMHPKQFPILRCIAENPNCTQCFVAQSLLISAATVGVSVKRLMSSGYIDVRADSDDLRATRLVATELGMTELTKMKQAFKRLSDIKLSGFTESELNEFLRLLEKSQANLEAFFTNGGQK